MQIQQKGAEVRMKTAKNVNIMQIILVVALMWDNGLLLLRS